MSTLLPAPLRLPALLLAGALAACAALDPLPGPPVVEQHDDDTLPGTGTYALVVDPAPPPEGNGSSDGAPGRTVRDPSTSPGNPSTPSDKPDQDEASGDSAAASGATLSTGKGSAAPPPLHDADGPASGLMAPRSGIATLVAPKDSTTLQESLEPVAPRPRPLAPEDRHAVETALVRALEWRGYHALPPAQASWLVSVGAAREQRREYLVPASKQMLLPRMRCDARGCMITEQWEHFGPPLRGDSLRRYQVDVVEVRIRNRRNGELVWQGRLSSEPGDDGHPNRHDLDKALRRLLRELPVAPRRNPLAEPVQADASLPGGP